jgi:hypothetical protein
VARQRTDDADDTGDADEWQIMLDGRRFLVVGRTSDGAPYGIFEDEVSTEPHQR